MKRTQEEIILQDLNKKMVLLTGPRQVGKTYLSKQISQHFEHSLYLNYDNLGHRQMIQQRNWLPETELLILDEIHKMTDWKNYLKGLYDTKAPHMKLLVTGSARLEAYRGVGDSLAGRFFRHRLMPLSCREIFSNSLIAGNPSITDNFLVVGGQLNRQSQPEHNRPLNLIKRFLNLGEFPEPFLSNDPVEAQRWRSQYIDRLIREDILDFEKIHDFKKVQLTLALLRKRIGSPVSYTSIANDIEASPNTVKRYIEIFEALFIIFRVTPYSKNIARSLLKEPKIYFFDTGMVEGGDGIKLENHIAVSLLKDLLFLEDTQGVTASLHYLRTKDGKEVDFCRLINHKVLDAIEVKTSDASISKGLSYFKKRYPFKFRQLVHRLSEERVVDGIEIRDAEKFLQAPLGVIAN